MRKTTEEECENFKLEKVIRLNSEFFEEVSVSEISSISEEEKQSPSESIQKQPTHESQQEKQVTSESQQSSEPDEEEQEKYARIQYSLRN